MDELDELVRKYGGTIEIFRVSTIISLPVKLPEVDVGFSTTYYASWLGRFFPFLRHFPMPMGLYVYGDRSEALSRIIGRDEELCSAIRYVLDQYAFDMECSDARLVTRFVSLYRTLSLDPSGGWHLISNLRTIAFRLAQLDYSDFYSTPRKIWMWGPRAYQKISNIAIFLIAFLIPILIIIFAVHGAHPVGIHR
jgi:hypothetical protein